MTPKNTTDPEENSLGVLDEAASLDTAVIGILGGTAQVSVTLPRSDDDDDLADDGVVDGEVIGDLVIDPPPAVESKTKTKTLPKAPRPDPVPAAAAVAQDAEPDEARVVEAASEAVAPAEPAVVTGVIDEPLVIEPIVIEVTALESDAVADAVVDAVVVDDQVSETIADDRDTADQRAAEEAAAAQFLAKARSEIETAPPAPASAVQAATEKETTVSTPEERSVVPQPARAAARADVTLTSKRLDDLGESSRESADLLTADRLLDPHRITKPEPEGAWSHFLYAVSGRRINIGDGRRARERKALSARIAAPLAGGARFVPVLSRKGGVGKTTITALLGMALADAREDRVIAVDANPDRGTLAERIVRPHHSKSVRDLVRIHDDVKGYHDISAIVARDATRLDVLASDADPRIAEAFSDSDYRDVAGVAAHYYSLVLTDTGTGIVHSVMSATLDLADQIVIVSGLSVDEARLASETLTWLETNGYEEQAREAIVVLNQSTPGTPLVRLNELQAHFATRARSVVRVPYDPQIAGGGTIVFANLLPETRIAARELAALLVEGLRAKAA
ncbi:MinD/ParA family ATP-binding protein [Microbacterium maritypicum]|uniref:MinD/ParA family protein n=1 Tax=Microbacterium maritypicum TaxID=33918 RepID=A0ACD4BAC1_MICMQ|nr:MinD/ParA family protein [Microbacterium liquefaciens]UTT54334.1 MinD/ParA family protein [Microbacterium liquefaciens]